MNFYNFKIDYIILIVIGVAILCFYFMPQNLFESSLNDSHCIHQKIFSKPCPGCGITRATYHVLHFDFKEAIEYNPSIIFLIIALFSEVLYRLSDAIKSIVIFRILAYSTFCISLFVVYIYRLF